jgi:hypothetical protein
MFCTKCGKPIPAGNAFCVSCGAKVGQGALKSQETVAIPTFQGAAVIRPEVEVKIENIKSGVGNQIPQTLTIKTSNRKIKILAGLAIVATLIIGLSLAVYKRQPESILSNNSSNALHFTTENDYNILTSKPFAAGDVLEANYGVTKSAGQHSERTQESHVSTSKYLGCLVYSTVTYNPKTLRDEFAMHHISCLEPSNYKHLTDFYVVGYAKDIDGEVGIKLDKELGKKFVFVIEGNDPNPERFFKSEVDWKLWKRHNQTKS